MFTKTHLENQVQLKDTGDFLSNHARIDIEILFGLGIVVLIYVINWGWDGP